MDRITDTVKTLLIINVIFFIGSAFLGDEIKYFFYEYFTMYFPKHPYFEYWQILTHMFMHGSPSHIFFNMFNLFMFGSILENHLGKQHFLFLYFSAGLGALGLHLLVDYINFLPVFEKYIQNGIPEQEIIKRMIISEQFPGGVLGASGAIAGLFAGFAVLFPNLPLQIMFIPFPIKAKYLIGGYFLLDLYFAITGKSMFSGVNIAHWAHIGGAVVGFIIIWYWKKNSFNDKRWY